MTEINHLDKHTLYELCVQSPTDLVALLRAIHGAEPLALGEDFAGTAALSHAWAEAIDTGEAFAVDLDAEALAFRAPHPRVRTQHADVLEASDPCDVLFVGNFSIGYWHTRADLIAYLRHARTRLRPGGVFCCDTYGGESSFITGAVHRPHPIPPALAGLPACVCRYTWEQRDVDPLTAMVTDIIHFRVERAGVIEQELPEAFVYRWRLWSVPELRDAFAEAGFASADVYAKLPDAVDAEGNAYVRPIEDAAEELEDDFIVLLGARA
ncbi:MAG: class I SAM-dependent methyltransferase [Planctomycetota bacterium]